MYRSVKASMNERNVLQRIPVNLNHSEVQAIHFHGEPYAALDAGYAALDAGYAALDAEYAALDASTATAADDPTIEGPDARGIMPGIPPIIPKPAPMGNALAPQRQSQVHTPLFSVPVPVTILGVVDVVVVDDEFVVSMSRHAVSLVVLALMLKRMPSSQWSDWPQ